MVYEIKQGEKQDRAMLMAGSIRLVDNFVAAQAGMELRPPFSTSLAELLIPHGLLQGFSTTHGIKWLLDHNTAAYPFEMLQIGGARTIPLSVAVPMVRNILTGSNRTTVQSTVTRTALVVGDPSLNGFMPQLPGAYAEGELVANLLTAGGYASKQLLNTADKDILVELFSKEYRIIHLAGHSMYDAEHPRNAGLVIGNNLFLSANEIAQMRLLPELVFINCCYLGKEGNSPEALYSHRNKLAASMGIQLIENGVKAVVMAGWPINDDAAHDFANTFYHHMLQGTAFGQAVLMARQLVYEKYPQSSTWGAYQCYGDPAFVLEQPELSEQAVDEPRSFRSQVEKIYRSTKILVADDLQKGRWGGQAESNGYVLYAAVKRSNIPGLFNVILNVKTTQAAKNWRAGIFSAQYF